MTDITIENHPFGEYVAFTANTLRGAAFCGEYLKGCPRSLSGITWAVPRTRVAELRDDALVCCIEFTDTTAPPFPRGVN